jgi:hypothetical protein
MLPFSLSRAGTLSSECTTDSFLGLTNVRTCILPLSPGRSGVKLRLECLDSFLGYVCACKLSTTLLVLGQG